MENRRYRCRSGKLHGIGLELLLPRPRPPHTECRPSDDPTGRPAPLEFCRESGFHLDSRLCTRRLLYFRQRLLALKRPSGNGDEHCRPHVAPQLLSADAAMHSAGEQEPLRVAVQLLH